MILTTTNSIEGHKIVDYLGIVTGIDVNRSITKTTFNHEKTIEDREVQIQKAKEAAFQKLATNAIKLKANAIVGIKVDIEFLEQRYKTIVSVTGTAVKVI